MAFKMKSPAKFFGRVRQMASNPRATRQSNFANPYSRATSSANRATPRNNPRVATFPQANVAGPRNNPRVATFPQAPNQAGGRPNPPGRHRSFNPGANLEGRRPSRSRSFRRRRANGI